MKRYTVRIGENCWLAPWHGDPGRTIVKENARVFCSRQAADKAIKAAYKFRPLLLTSIEEELDE